MKKTLLLSCFGILGSRIESGLAKGKIKIVFSSKKNSSRKIKKRRKKKSIKKGKKNNVDNSV